MGPCSRRPWLGRNPTDRGKSRGVPLPLVTGANEHDVTQIDVVLRAITVKRKTPSVRRSKHLCTDAGYRGRLAMEVIKSHSYIPHVVGRRTEAKAKQ